MKNLSLLIGTCDSYSFLWNNFVKLANKYWQVDCPKLFVSETKSAEYPGYEFYTSGIACDHSQNWSNRMLSAIDLIDTEYTFFVLEDYYFTENLDKAELDFHIDFMEEVSANKIMFETLCPQLTLINPINRLGRTIYQLSPYSKYLTSLQPAIWKTEYLKNVMQKNWTPWEFELNGSSNLMGRETNTYLALREKRAYWNALRKGKRLSPGWEELREKENLTELRGYTSRM